MSSKAIVTAVVLTAAVLLTLVALVLEDTSALAPGNLKRAAFGRTSDRHSGQPPAPASDAPAVVAALDRIGLALKALSDSLSSTVATPAAAGPDAAARPETTPSPTAAPLAAVPVPASNATAAQGRRADAAASSSTLPPSSMFVPKTRYSNRTRFVFFAGLEGTGHHLWESVLKRCPHCESSCPLQRALWSMPTQSGIFMTVHASE